MNQVQGLQPYQFVFFVSVNGGKLIVGKFYDAILNNINSYQRVFDQASEYRRRKLIGLVGALGCFGACKSECGELFPSFITNLQREPMFRLQVASLNRFY